MGSKIRDFCVGMGWTSGDKATAAGPAAAGDQPPPSRADFIAQVLKQVEAGGYKAGASDCEDRCLKKFNAQLDKAPTDQPFAPFEKELQDCLAECRRTHPPDPSGLHVNVVYVSDNGGKSSVSRVSHEKKITLVAIVANRAKARSGPYRIRFEVTGPVAHTYDLHEDDGSLPGADPKHVVHIDDWEKPGKFQLRACVFDPSNPGTMIHCSDPITFEVF